MRWRPVRAQRSVGLGCAQAGLFSLEMGLVRGADAVMVRGRQHRGRRFGEPSADPAGSETPSMRVISSCREPGGLTVTRAVGDVQKEGGSQTGKVEDRKPVKKMHDREKSDGRVLPVKLPNNAQSEERRRRWREGDQPRGTRPAKRAPDPEPGRARQVNSDRVRGMAQKDKDARFTALLHHVNVERLRAAYWALEPKAAPGVDGVTWEDYRRRPRSEPSRSSCSCP